MRLWQNLARGPGFADRWPKTTVGQTNLGLGKCLQSSQDVVSYTFTKQIIILLGISQVNRGMECINNYNNVDID